MAGVNVASSGLASEKDTKDFIENGLVWRGRKREWVLGEKTILMGVLNVTPDSFFDGERYFDRDAAVERGTRMVEEGADIIDIGGESSKPGAKEVDVKEELRRVIPVISCLAEKVNVPISIDTTKAEVAESALDAGAEIINDISAMRFDPAMVRVASEFKAAVILMHMRGTPETMQNNVVYDDVVSEIYQFLYDRLSDLLKHGIEWERMAVDPGIGFGKSVKDNLRIINEIGTFSAYGRPVVIGPSRKSFIGHVLNLDVMDRLEGTSASVAAGVLKGGQILRVHDVKEMRRVVDMVDAIRNA